MKRLCMLILVLALLAGLVEAKASHITVLSVAENDTTSGGVADVYLEVRPGTGAVYIDSFPLTRLDTQLSARFAREYACMLADVDCSRLDFFFVIRASSTIIGGPSAGGAMTVLAYSELADAPLRQDTVMTGTIGSGGIIGPVGGVAAKVRAAERQGFAQVLVPFPEYDPNISAGIAVIAVADVEDAIYHFTGQDVRLSGGEISVPDAYTQKMEEVADSLCTRSEQLTAMVNATDEVRSFIEQGLSSSARQQYYTAASHCFSANLQLREQLLENRSQDERRRLYHQLQEDIHLLDRSLPENITGIADLEVYMIVRERLVDARGVLEREEYENISASGLGYALERYSSALAWSSFFGVLDERPLQISPEQLETSCRARIAETEERINYITYITKLPLVDTRRNLGTAHEFARQEEWALCLFTASKAKAEADSVLSALYGGDDLDSAVQIKLQKVEQLIARAADRGSFPLISYSYHEYATNLNSSYSANLYTEYALNLASLDIYFARERTLPPIDTERLWILLSGIAIGFSTGVLSWELLHRRKELKTKKGRRARRST